MQGLLYGVWGYVILTENVCRGSVVSLLGGKYWLHCQTLPGSVEYGESQKFGVRT